MGIARQVIEYERKEEHFLRRLGGALLIHWDSVPTDVQELLIQQAAEMLDPIWVFECEPKIRDFIATHSGDAAVFHEPRIYGPLQATHYDQFRKES